MWPGSLVSVRTRRPRFSPGLYAAGQLTAKLRDMNSQVTLLQQVLYYLRAHLADRDLGAEQIASAHGISVRQLQRTWSEMGVELRDWITGERLAAARCELARSDPVAGSVADVALHWDFTDPADFRARFQAAFGISPAWRGPGDQARDEGPVPG